MPHLFPRTTRIFWLFILLLLLLPSSPVDAQTSQENVATALKELHAWVGDDDNGQRWRRFLKSELLEAQLKETNADRTAVADILKKYSSDTSGLDKAEFIAVRDALQTWLEELSLVKIAELPQLARDLKADFQAISSSQVEQSKADLIAATNRLDSFLSGASDDRIERWRKFILWDDMQGQLGSENEPDLKVLRRVGAKYYTNKSGLELAPFTDVRDALLDYVNVTHFSSQAKLEATYVNHLENLAKRLESFASKPTSADAITIGRTLGWLKSAGQAPTLVSAVRRHYCQPNLVGHISERLVAVGVSQEIDDTTEVNEYILGTSISGVAHTVGNVTASLIPSNNAASIEIHLVGQAHSQNVGQNGPATIYNNGLTEIDARKVLRIDGTGLHAAPAVAHCVTSTDITNISASSRLVQNIAWKKAGEMQYQAEIIASQRAEDRVQRRMDSQSNEMLEEANASFLEKIRDPLLRRGSLPQLIHFSTTAEQIQLRVAHANDFQISTSGPAPTLNGNLDLAVRLHESLIGNFSESVLGGETLTDEQLAQTLEDLTGSVPDELIIGPEKDPWSITFAASQPIVVSFQDNIASISIRARHFTRGENEINNSMVITATYKLEKTTDGIHLTRQGEVVVKGQQGVAGTVFKTFVQKKFNALFKEDIAGNGFVLPGDWAQAGKLRLRQMICADGWLGLGWEQPSENVRTAKKAD